MRFPALALAAVSLLLLLALPRPAPAGEDAPDAGPVRDLPTWNDPTTGMEFVLLPGGCFLMGSPPGEHGHKPDETTHQVCVEPFWMGRYEVTQAQFADFVEATGYKTHAERQGWIRVWDERWMNVYDKNWREPHFRQKDDEPVLAMSWDDARAMAHWLSSKGQGRFRLPTEAEWEYAARAGTRTARYWGDEYDARVCKYANVGDLTHIVAFGSINREPTPAAPCEDGYVYSSPVGSFAPNAFGLYDMLGNAQEWCEEENPDDPKLGHMVRGGSFLSITDDVRAAGREWVAHDYGVYFTLGFRLVRDK